MSRVKPMFALEPEKFQGFRSYIRVYSNKKTTDVQKKALYEFSVGLGLFSITPCIDFKVFTQTTDSSI